MALWMRDYQRQVMGGGLGVWVRRTPGGRELVCEFCPECGTRLFHQMVDQVEMLSIKPGTLDAPYGLTPIAHIWTRSAQPWVQWPAGVLCYPENPPAFDDVFAAWQRAREI